MRKSELRRRLDDAITTRDDALRTVRSMDIAAAAESSNGRPYGLVFSTDEDEHRVRVAVLAVAFMLKNRADATDVVEGSHVEYVLAQYERVKSLLALLGPTTEDERSEAFDLWDEAAA